MLMLAIGSLVGVSSAACLPIPPTCWPPSTCKGKSPRVAKTKPSPAVRPVR
jgi:hypothetical protein